MVERNRSYSSNASCGARERATFSRVLRGGLVVGAFVALTSGVFLISNPDLDLFGSDGVQSVRRLLTTKSLVDYELNVDLDRTKSAQKETTTLATEEPDAVETSEFDDAANELGVDSDLEPDPDADALATPELAESSEEQILDAPTDPQEEIAPELDAPEFTPSVDVDSDSESSAKTRAKSVKPRLFAHAANLPNAAAPDSRYFAFATNIVEKTSVASPNYFSGEAKRALDARASERNLLERRLELIATSETPNSVKSSDETPSSVAQVGYEEAPRAKDAIEHANYETLVSNAAPRAAAAPEVLQEAAPVSRELTESERQEVEGTRAELRAYGILGAHIERWDARGFRATGLVRGANGKSTFKEAFGATPTASGEALLRLVEDNR